MGVSDRQNRADVINGSSLSRTEIVLFGHSSKMYEIDLRWSPRSSQKATHPGSVLRAAPVSLVDPGLSAPARCDPSILPV